MLDRDPILVSCGRLSDAIARIRSVRPSDPDPQDLASARAHLMLLAGFLDGVAPVDDPGCLFRHFSGPRPADEFPGLTVNGRPVGRQSDDDDEDLLGVLDRARVEPDA